MPELVPLRPFMARCAGPNCAGPITGLLNAQPSFERSTCRLMRMIPTLWSSSVTYQKGSIVADSENTLWDSILNNNVGSGNQPGVNFQAWVPYFGPLTCEVYNGNTGDAGGATYSASEIVYTTAGDGTYNVYRSLVSANTLDPAFVQSVESGRHVQSKSDRSFVP